MAKTDNNITSKFLACIEAKRLESFVDDESLLPVYASSTAKIYPYQIAAARFALRSDYLKGCVLCDEASLGKTYEALLVAGQMWYEGKESILIVVPAILLSQWLKKLNSEFTIPYVFWNNTKKLPEENGIVITTYDIAERHYQTIKEREWNLAIFDEADVLSNFNKESVKNLKSVLGEAFKLLLTPTPITKDIRDIYGLIHFIDETVLPDIDWYYKRYYKHPERFSELDWISKYCFRTLKRQTTEYVNFSERIPLTIGYPLIQEEKELYRLVEKYINTFEKAAYQTDDNYRLSLMYFKALSSSPDTFIKLLENPLSRAYGEEKEILLNMKSLAQNIKTNSKTIHIIKILKTVFKHLKTMKLNQKVLVFCDNNLTADILRRKFYPEFNAITYKDSSSIDEFRENEEIQILVATDEIAKGVDIEFCPVVVNYDLPYNSITLEQRICRCHRQGQTSDVLVINLVGDNNMTEVRLLELINKRTLQFSSIFGMSDDIVGNFDVKIKEVLQQIRHKDEVTKAFKENLTINRESNEELVEGSENILFTTFTKSISDKVKITPEYIEERIEEINADLWKVVKFYFQNIKPDWYEIDDEKQTLKLIEGYNRPYLFDYRDDMNRRKYYNGYQQYGMAKDFKPERGRITLTTEFAKGILKELDMLNDNEAKIYVDSDIEPCEIGFYNTSILSSKDTSKKRSILIGQTKSGEFLNEEKCIELLKLPVKNIETRDTVGGLAYGKLLTDFECGNLDNRISKEDILQEFLESRKGSIADEIEQINLQAKHKKTQLESTLKDLAKEIENIEKEMNNGYLAEIEKLKLRKQLIAKKKELAAKDDELFFSSSEIDVDTEKQIEELTKSYNFKVLSAPHFKLQFYGVKG